MEVRIKGRLTKKGADALGVPELAGKIIEHGPANRLGNVMVYYGGDYIGKAHMSRINAVKKKARKINFFRKIIGR